MVQHVPDVEQAPIDRKVKDCNMENCEPMNVGMSTEETLMRPDMDERSLVCKGPTSEIE